MIRSNLAFVVLLASLLVACTPSDPSPSEIRTSDLGTDDATRHGSSGDSENLVVELSPEAASSAALVFAHAERRSIGPQLETTGRVGFDENRLAHVGPRIPGRVERVLASLGQKVASGEPLAFLDSIELGRAKSDFLQALARRELARETLAREEMLYGDRISSEQEVLVAKAALRETEAASASSKETLLLYGLSQREIDELGFDDPKASVFALRAPFDGKVVERHATQGELVAPGANLFTIADLSTVWVWIDVYERDLSSVHLEDDVEVYMDPYPGEVFVGKVSYIGDQVEATTRTVRARLDVANEKGRLRSGMFARIRLTDPHAAEDVAQGVSNGKAIVVPESAVQRDGGETIVFAVIGENRFERRAVVMGRKAGGWVEVLGKIEPGETVVAQGAFLLKSEAAKGEMGEGHSH